MAIYNYMTPKTDPWLSGSQNFSTPTALGGLGGSSLSASGGSTPIGQVAPPTLNTFTYSQDATQYPSWLRSQGENMANQAFEKQANQQVRYGNGGQGYMAALQARNNARLGFMGQAGQAQMGVETAQAAQHNQRNADLLQLYGLQNQARGYDLNYLASLNRASGGGGGGSTGSAGGGFPSHSMARTPVGTRVDMGQSAPGTIGLGGGMQINPYVMNGGNSSGWRS